MTNQEAIKDIQDNILPVVGGKSLRMAIEALKAQIDGDTISRQAAIDAVKKNTFRLTFAEEQNCEGHVAWSAEAVYSEVMEGALLDLPSAQPEKRTEERTETHSCDLIDRQAAIDAILAVTGNSSVRELYEHVQEHELSDMWSGGVNAAIDIIIAVPSAQPEPEWNNHTVACLLAELFGDTCACNYNGIDEWLPEKCEVIEACPNPVGVACWEQFLKHRAERIQP